MAEDGDNDPFGKHLGEENLAAEYGLSMWIRPTDRYPRYRHVGAFAKNAEVSASISQRQFTCV